MTKEQLTIHVGIDVSKDKLAVAIVGGGVRENGQPSNTKNPNGTQTAQHSDLKLGPLVRSMPSLSAAARFHEYGRS